MIVAVTGALGFVASHLVPALLARGDRVLAVVRPGRDATRLEALGCEVRHAQLAEAGLHPDAFRGAPAVVHLAGMALVPGLLPALASAGVTRGVFVGSAGVHTRLRSRGAEAKRRGEQALAASALAWTILRPSMIYGTPADRNLARLLRLIERVPLVPVPGGGRTPQQPVHVLDLCQAILAALDRPHSAGRAYDVGGPEAIPLAELVRAAGRALGRPAWPVSIPLAPAHLAMRTLRALRLPAPVSPEQVLRLQESKAVDIGPARADLGFAPRSFEAGIAEEVRLLRAPRA